MYEHHPQSPFQPPDSPNVGIWRYLDLAKFVFLLEHEALYFSRADRLGDPYEGAVSDPAITEREMRDREIFGDNEREWASGLSGHDSLNLLMVRSTFLSCWNISPVENAGLWSVYAGRGVAIRSTFERLRDSLSCDEILQIGVVRYIDYRSDPMPNDGLAPLVHKRKHYEWEGELRAAIVGRWTEEQGDKWRWAKEDPRLGIEVGVDLEQLIEEIRVAPGEQVLGDIVPALVHRYDLKVPVEQSALDDPPRF